MLFRGRRLLDHSVDFGLARVDHRRTVLDGQRRGVDGEGVGPHRDDRRLFAAGAGLDLSDLADGRAGVVFHLKTGGKRNRRARVRARRGARAARSSMLEPRLATLISMVLAAGTHLVPHRWNLTSITGVALFGGFALLELRFAALCERSVATGAALA
jgi:hypothetical protein